MPSRVVLIIILACLPIIASGDGDNRPAVVAKPARVGIDVAPAGRRLIHLPTLEFPLRIEPRCSPGLRIESVSISVADTRRTYSAQDFEKTATIETTLRLPGRQIGPLAIDAFCADKSEPATRRVADALTANVSLHCTNDTQQSVNYEMLALDVLLHCDTKEPVQPDFEGGATSGQESPSSSPRF